ncbi:MAG TPA: hypothetical protein VF595_10900, partial [Tepidisphaeraceae bacterium]
MNNRTQRAWLATAMTIGGIGCAAHAQQAADVAASATAAATSAVSTSAIERTDDGIVVPAGGGFVKLGVRSPTVVRVMFAPDRAFFSRQSLVVVPPGADRAHFRVVDESTGPTIDTGVVRATVDRSSGRVSFFDVSGKPLLAEGERTLTPATVQGQRTYHVRQTWQPHEDESLYGLGQHQFDAINLKGMSVDLWQRNTSIVVPLLVSSRGYGIFWDDLAYTRFGDLRAWQPLNGPEFDGGVVGRYFGDLTFTNQVATRNDDKIEFDFFNNRDLLTEDGTPANPTTQPATRPATAPGGGG